MFISLDENPYMLVKDIPNFVVSMLCGEYRGKTLNSFIFDASRATSLVLSKVLKARDIETNLIKVYPELFNLSKQQLTRGLKHLKDNGIVLRLDSQSYFLNPYLVLPMSKTNLKYNPRSVYKLWDSLYK